MKKFLKKYSATILTAIGIVGAVSSVVLAIKATPNAEKDIAKEETKQTRPLTNIEKVKVCWKEYIPTMLCLTGTITCIAGANILNKKQQASLISAYAFLSNQFKEYKKIVTKLYGDDAQEKIRAEIMREKAMPEENTELFYDEFSERYFDADRRDVKNAEYEFNRYLSIMGYASLNDYYDFIGLEPIAGGDDIGWSIATGCIYQGYSWVSFKQDLVKLEDGLECITISMPFEPSADFLGINF